MRRFIKGSDGKFRGSSPTAKKAPTAQPATHTAQNVRDCGRDTPSAALEQLSEKWSESSGLPSTRVVPQNSVVSAPSLKAARELTGAEYSHVRARAIIDLGHITVQERLLQAGFVCAIPAGSAQPGPSENTESPAEDASLETLVGSGVWRIQPHPEDPTRTIVVAPQVANDASGWKHLDHGLRHARGFRAFAPKTHIIVTASTPHTTPPPPPAGFQPIKGVRALIYSA